jgi:hypothetical protein
MDCTNDFCVQIPLEANMDQCVETLNKKLTGKANPRTLVQPTISPPSHDITVWRQNPNINHSQINVKTTSNPSLAGFSFPDMTVCVEEDEPDLPEINSPFVVPIQPGIYTSTDVFQPINNNLGIAYPPQFPNSTFQDGSLFFDTDLRPLDENHFFVKQKDFELIGRDFRAQEVFSSPSISAGDGGPSSVYDPRFVGYGPGNRAYQDNLLGSVKYYYDDISAVRMPQYITRNKLDSCVTPCGDKYGDLRAGYLSMNEARKGAETSWRKNSLDFRTNLSKSLMRKKDEEMVQRRLAPKYTF